MKKSLFAKAARSAHGGRAVPDETVVAAQPLTPQQSSGISGSFNRSEENDLASASGQPSQSLLVDAVLDHLRKTRMQKSRPH